MHRRTLWIENGKEKWLEERMLPNLYLKEKGAQMGERAEIIHIRKRWLGRKEPHSTMTEGSKNQIRIIKLKKLSAQLQACKKNERKRKAGCGTTEGKDLGETLKQGWCSVDR